MFECATGNCTEPAVSPVLLTQSPRYATLLGQEMPTPGFAGGPDTNGTYLGKKLVGRTKLAFMRVNNLTRIEFLAVCASCMTPVTNIPFGSVTVVAIGRRM
jgi:hypothetical protein